MPNPLDLNPRRRKVSWAYDAQLAVRFTMKPAWILACIFALAAACGNKHTEAPADDSATAPQGPTMRIRFERSGGFAGMMTNVEIDAGSLPAGERDAIATLVANADFFALPATIAETATRGADRFNYRITIESDGRSHTVETSSGAAPASLVPLLEWLDRAARQVGAEARTPR
jgi:hypothetical protein